MRCERNGLRGRTNACFQIGALFPLHDKQEHLAMEAIMEKHCILTYFVETYVFVYLMQEKYEKFLMSKNSWEFIYKLHDIFFPLKMFKAWCCVAMVFFVLNKINLQVHFFFVLRIWGCEV